MSVCVCARRREVTKQRKFLFTELNDFPFLPLKWILHGQHHNVFIIGATVMFYYSGNNNMTRCAAYKSYTFNCCWFSCDFPGVGRRAVEESGEINQRNNETMR